MKQLIKHTLAYVMMLLSFVAYADDKVSLIVTNDGESIKSLYLDYSAVDFCYYTIESDSDDLKRIKKSDILIIKLADGTIIDVSAMSAIVSTNGNSIKQNNGNAASHEAVTIKTINNFVPNKKKGYAILTIEDSNGNLLCFRKVTNEDFTLALTMPIKGIKYKAESYVIPGYIIVGEDSYTVKYIDDNAFSTKSVGFRKDVKEVILPETITRIGDRAFYGNAGLRRIILPESLRAIGKYAFYGCGNFCDTFEQLYIPAGVTEIGEKAFIYVGPNTSPRGYFQGNLTSIPAYITTGNCTGFGIDEEAVEAYMNRRE